MAIQAPDMPAIIHLRKMPWCDGAVWFSLIELAFWGDENHPEGTIQIEPMAYGETNQTPGAMRLPDINP